MEVVKEIGRCWTKCMGLKRDYIVKENAPFAEIIDMLPYRETNLIHIVKYVEFM